MFFWDSYSYQLVSRMNGAKHMVIIMGFVHIRCIVVCIYIHMYKQKSYTHTPVFAPKYMQHIHTFASGIFFGFCLLVQWSFLVPLVGGR